VRLRQIIPITLFLTLLSLPGGAAGSNPPETGTLKITVPAGLFRDVYWVYVDGKMLSSPGSETANEWNFVATPMGWFSLYSKGGQTAEVDGNGKILWLDAAVARANHFYRTAQVSLRAGTHSVKVLIPAPASKPSYDFGFPFVRAEKTVVVHQGQITEYSSPVPDGWTVSSDPRFWEVPVGSVCPDKSRPDPGKIQADVQWYSDMPVVAALRRAPASYLSGSKRVVRLDLPAELGGPLEFDDNQVQQIVVRLHLTVTSRIPPSNVISYCQSTYPQWSNMYAQYGILSDKIRDDLNSFRNLARDNH
jgi:hypothetical protein